MKIDELGLVGKYVNVMNENEIYDFIKIPKDDIDERVEILEKELRKELKIQILGKVKEKLKGIFDQASEQFERLELPLPTSIEIDYYIEYDHTVCISDYVLYDSEDRSIGSDEIENIKIEKRCGSIPLDDEIRDFIYSINAETLVSLTGWEGYRIIFGDSTN